MVAFRFLPLLPNCRGHCAKQVCILISKCSFSLPTLHTLLWLLLPSDMVFPFPCRPLEHSLPTLPGFLDATQIGSDPFLSELSKIPCQLLIWVPHDCPLVSSLYKSSRLVATKVTYSCCHSHSLWL